MKHRLSTMICLSLACFATSTAWSADDCHRLNVPKISACVESADPQMQNSNSERLQAQASSKSLHLDEAFVSKEESVNVDKFMEQNKERSPGSIFSSRVRRELNPAKKELVRNLHEWLKASDSSGARTVASTFDEEGVGFIPPNAFVNPRYDGRSVKVDVYKFRNDSTRLLLKSTVSSDGFENGVTGLYFTHRFGSSH